MISIIIPVKGHTIIEKLLVCLQRVEYPQETEIVVVDSAPQALKNIRKKFPNIRWLDCSVSNFESVPEQRNYGVQKAKGDLIVFIDADCLVTKKWLVNLTAPLLHEDEQISCGWIKSIRKYPVKWQLDYENKDKEKYLSFAPTMNSAFKKSVFEKVGLYDPKFSYGAEDVDICWRADRMGYKIRYCQNAVIYHDWGDFKRNTHRMYGYGKANYAFFAKHYKDVRHNLNILYGLFAFPVFILGMPLIIFLPYYPLLILIPFLKTVLDSKPPLYSLESIYFNFLYGIGFIVEFFSSVKKKSDHAFANNLN